MAGMGKGVRWVMLGLLVLSVATGGCSAKDGATFDKPPAKGVGCRLGMARLFG